MFQIPPAFSRRKHGPLDRRRRRWSDTAATIAAIAGVVADQAASRVESFPNEWRPYVQAAAFAFGAIATLERIERMHDYNRAFRKRRDDNE